MIRPFTCLCLLLACGSGLYLYQSKHKVELLDQRIEAVVAQTRAARARIGVLRAEWALMNDPDRLTDLAGKFLALKATTPAQFTTMANLDAKLPPVPAPAPPPANAPVADVAVAGGDAQDRDGPDRNAPDRKVNEGPTDTMAQAAPKADPAVAAAHLAAAKPAKVAHAKPVRETLAQAVRPERAVVTRVAVTTLGRPPSYVPPPAPRSGVPPVPVMTSALGMARMISPPAPYVSAN